MPVSPVVRCVACAGTREVAEVVVVLQTGEVEKREVNPLCRRCAACLALYLFERNGQVAEEVDHEERFLVRVETYGEHVVPNNYVGVYRPTELGKLVEALGYPQFVARLMADQPGT